MLVIAQMLLALLLAGLFALLPGPRLWTGRPAFSVAGAALVVAAGVVALRAWRDLGPAFRIHPAPRSQAQLVARGIYAHWRHPMYGSVLLGATGMLLLRPGRFVAAAWAAHGVFYLAKARYEEGLLRQRYPEYEAYRRRSHGVLPWRPHR